MFQSDGKISKKMFQSDGKIKKAASIFETAPFLPKKIRAFHLPN